jgi:hypothetical protein
VRPVAAWVNRTLLRILRFNRLTRLRTSVPDPLAAREPGPEVGFQFAVDPESLLAVPFCHWVIHLDHEFNGDPYTSIGWMG